MSPPPPGGHRTEQLAPLLLMFGCWGFQRPSLKQGAAGTAHFKPGGVFFRDGQRPNRRRWFASRGAAHALNAYQARLKAGYSAFAVFGNGSFQAGPDNSAAIGSSLGVGPPANRVKTGGPC
jgi:hypothetical protein